ncbi:MAG: hypothetical protein H6581_13650 [Bacteroidia bacterium]|nr:hypothetical protein [Bacteroidia bacterium]
MKALWDRFIMWLYAVGWAMLIIFFWGKRGRRMSHHNGIVARGKARVVDHPEFPENDFFIPGREFNIRLRHAGASYADDAMLVIRGAALKFSDNNYKSPLDIEMNTGKFALFWSLSNFLTFVTNRNEKDGEEYESYYKVVPEGLPGSRESLRRPNTYTQLYYYTKTCFHFNPKNGKKYYVKFRLTPGNKGTEDGIPTEEELEKLWIARILPGETRSRNYLKDDFKARIAEGPIRYWLQMQLHEASPADTQEIFNPAVYWTEDVHPWMDVCEVTVDSYLPYEEGEFFRSNIAHQPKFMGLIKAKNIHDYNSLNYMRAMSGPAKIMRIMVYKIFGVPKEYPDYGIRNVTGYAKKQE